MSGWISIPRGTPWIRNATLADLSRADIRIEAGRIAAIEPAGTAAGGVDLDGGMVFPCFVDVHTHLDKGHIWPRTPNPDGTFAGALDAVRAVRGRASPEDILTRMEFGLACSLAHGTAAIRTHLDTYFPEAEATWRVFRTLRDAWAGRITLQGVSVCGLDHFDGGKGARIADLVAASGGILGGVVRLSGDGHRAIPPGFQDRLENFFALAEARGLAIDLHVDEDDVPGSAALALIARTAIRRGFRQPIQVGHCCSLALQPDSVIAETIRLVADAGIAVASLPMCNMYLQGRVPGRTPSWRGITLLHEFAAAGVKVSVASDNCRDPFYAYGDHDMWEVFASAVRIAHLDHAPARWTEAIGATPASVMGIEAGTITVGAIADLVLFRGRDFSETLSRSQHDRVVLRAGRAIDATPPDYRTLDALLR